MLLYNISICSVYHYVHGKSKVYFEVSNLCKFSYRLSTDKHKVLSMSMSRHSSCTYLL